MNFLSCTNSCHAKNNDGGLALQIVKTIKKIDNTDLTQQFSLSISPISVINQSLDCYRFLSRGVECMIYTAVVNIGARGAVPPVAPKRTGSGRAPILCTGNRSRILFACKGGNQ